MRNWNVVVTVAEHRFVAACKLLEPLGPVRRTGYYNVLVMHVEDPRQFLDTLCTWLTAYPETADVLARISPVTDRFIFQSKEELETKAREIALSYAPALAGKSFHVRVHRRGWRNKVDGQALERMLGEAVFDQLVALGTPARVVFDDPDAIIAVETIDNQAGAALWTREDLRRCALLKME